MGSSSDQLPHHIVMLPFLAHGHLRPFLSLARQIQQRTFSSFFTITIASTSLNLQYLRRSSNKNDNNIRFAELPFLYTDQNTENLSTPKIQSLTHASLRLESPFRELIRDITAKDGRPPLCIISDIFFGWAVDIAKSLGSVSVTFTTCGAYGTAAFVSLWLHLPHRCTDGSDDDDYFSLPGFPERCRLRRSHLNPHLRTADGTDEWSGFMKPQISLSLKSHGWLCNTVEEIEPLGLEILRTYTKLPVWSIGSVSSSSSSSCGKELGMSAQNCLEWLNAQSPKSVVYISFGSQNTISACQMMELAKGLEKSGKPFIWVVRPPLEFDIKGEFRLENWLPEGFEDRMEKWKRGLVVRNWAPQLEILSHESTAVFISHCGWNSVMESLSHGVPIVAWPLGAEQAYNAKMLVEELGVSVELTMGLERVINGEEVKRVMDLVMDKNGKGVEMRKKADEIKDKIRGAMRDEGQLKGSSVMALDDFLSAILADTEKTRNTTIK